jgi:hypothetical protein
MNDYEFKYEQDGQIHAEAVEAPTLEIARTLFHVTHPRGAAHILAVVMPVAPQRDLVCV